MSEYRLFKVIRTDESKYFDIEYVRDVVTCRECKHWQNNHLCKKWSIYGTIETLEDDFCSYGERSSE